MTLRSSDLQSDSDLDSICNSCDVFNYVQKVWGEGQTHVLPILYQMFKASGGVKRFLNNVNKNCGMAEVGHH